MPSSKQSSTQVPNGLFEFVPSDEYRISLSLTPGTPLIATFCPRSPDAVDPEAAPELPAVVGFLSLELLHAATTSVTTIISSTERRRRAGVGRFSMSRPSVGCW